MRNRRSYKTVGTFKLSQPKILVSDPGYEKDEWCAAAVSECKPGQWRSCININKYVYDGRADERVASLFAYHESVPREILGTIHLEQIDDGYDCFFRYRTGWERRAEIGVDSGQAGFFDYDKYGKNSLFKKQGKCGFGDKWYSNCCDKTLYDHAGIVANCGVNSCSGFGDGTYPVWIHKKNGEVDAIALFFMPDNELKEM